MTVRITDLPAHVRAKVAPAKKKPARARSTGREAAQKKSALEEAFAFQLRCQGDHFPAPVREYQFSEGRGWAFDFAWPDRHVAVEIEGAVWKMGRHQRPEGFLADIDKYNTAALLGWVVIRVADVHIQSMKAMAWLEAALNPSSAHRIVGR